MLNFNNYINNSMIYENSSEPIYRPGDVVVVNRNLAVYIKNLGWFKDMHDYIGKECIIRNLHQYYLLDGITAYDIIGSSYYFPEDCLDFLDDELPLH